jgi:hypothetical protein
MESLFQHSVFPASSSLQVLSLFPVLIATVGAPRIPAHWQNAYTDILRYRHGELHLDAIGGREARIMFGSGHEE